MMKKTILLSCLTAMVLFAAPVNNNNEKGQVTVQKQIEQLEKQVKLQQKYLKYSIYEIRKLKKELKEVKKRQKISRNIYFKKIAPMLANNHLYWNLGLRSTFDFVDYKTKSGKKYTNNILSNRVDLKGVYKVDDGLKTVVEIEANNIYGMNNINRTSPYNNISWVASETPDDTTLRVKKAYFLWHFGDGYMLSFGRRDSVDGFPANLATGDEEGSPLAIIGNLEFDGFAFRAGSNPLSKIFPKAKEWNSWIKICGGRAYSDAVGKWDTSGLPPYAKNGLSNTNFLIALIYPYVGEKFEIGGMAVSAWNMKGYNTYADLMANNMEDLGNYSAGTMMLKIKGLSNKSLYWRKSLAYILVAGDWTNPSSGKEMLGSTSNKFGKAIWLGLDMPGISANDRWGAMLTMGSKYWKNLAFAEDRVTGSLSSVRGTGFETYYHRKLRKALYLDTSMTLMDYKHSGSDGFFGVSGSPNQPDYVKRAFNIRVDIKYNF